MTPTDALDLARELIGTAGLSRAAGVSFQAAYIWHVCPARHANKVMKATGIPRSLLRPDYYPDALERVPAREYLKGQKNAPTPTCGENLSCRV